MGLDSAIASHIKSNQKMVSMIIFCFPLSLATNNFMNTYLLALIMIVFAMCSKEDVFPAHSREWYTSLYGVYFNHPYLPISTTAPCLTQVFSHSCLV